MLLLPYHCFKVMIMSFLGIAKEPQHSLMWWVRNQGFGFGVIDLCF